MWYIVEMTEISAGSILNNKALPVGSCGEAQADEHRESSQT